MRILQILLMLLLTTLSAVELPFVGDIPEVKETLKNYYIANHELKTRNKINIIQGIEYKTTDFTFFLRSKKNIKESDFVCARDVIYLLANLDNRSKSADKYPRDIDPKAAKALIERDRKAVNKLLQKDSDYVDFVNYISHNAIYEEYAKGFNLLEKLKLNIAEKEFLEKFFTGESWQEGDAEYPFAVEKTWLIVRILQDNTKDRINYALINESMRWHITLNTNELQRLYYDFVDFIKVRAKELGDKEINHTKNIIKTACAPIQKVSKKDEIIYVTFNKSKIKHIKDLDPKILKFKDAKFKDEQEN